MADTPVRHVVVMGVSGSGKSTLARALAERLGVPFGEADEFHPRSNVASMAAGVPLTDEDRWGWLDDVAAWMADHARAGRSTVVSCSALKRAYRDRLRRGVGGAVVFVHVSAPPELLRERMRSRPGHFMPASLLDSQLDTLESLQPDEPGTVLDARLDTDALVDAARAWLNNPWRS